MRLGLSMILCIFLKTLCLSYTNCSFYKAKKIIFCSELGGLELGAIREAKEFDFE